MWPGWGKCNPLLFISVLLDMPTIGCAKSRFIGDYKDPGSKKSDWDRL